MKLEGKPQKVLEVIRESVRDNPGAMRHHEAMSRKGGLAAAESKRRKKEQAEVHTTLLAEDAANVALENSKTLFTQSDEGDILPPVPEMPH